MSESTFGSDEGADGRESSHDADVSAGYDSDDQSDDAATVSDDALDSGLDDGGGTSHDADIDAGFDDSDGGDDSGLSLNR